MTKSCSKNTATPFKFIYIHQRIKFHFPPLHEHENRSFFLSDFLLCNYSKFWYYSYCIMENNKKPGENKNKSRTIHPKNHENFRNRKPRVQFYLFL